MMIPPQAVMLPTFMVINSFNWVNTYWGLMLPHIPEVSTGGGLLS